MCMFKSWRSEENDFSKNLEENIYHGFQRNINQQLFFLPLVYILSTKSAYKSHVTAVMAEENSALPSQE